MKAGKIYHKLSFYADTDLFTNKLFNWKVNSRQDALEALRRFQGKGWHIRAAWWLKCRDGLALQREKIYSCKSNAG